MGSFGTNENKARFHLEQKKIKQGSCLLQTFCSSSETYGMISYGSGWRENVINQCLELACDLIARQGLYH